MASPADVLGPECTEVRKLEDTKIRASVSLYAIGFVSLAASGQEELYRSGAQKVELSQIRAAMRPNARKQCHSLRPAGSYV